MPNSNYEKLPNIFGFCPTAIIPGGVPLQAAATPVVIAGLSSSIANPIRIGMGALVNDEFVTIQAISGTTVTLARGCADTIPQAHPAGSRIWFLETSTALLPNEYAATSVVSVKPLVRTSSVVMTVENSPPISVAMDFRLGRPYPPGNVRVNGQPWYTQGTTIDGLTPLSVNWAHRNRLTQREVLVDHEQGSIVPETDQQYLIQLYASDFYPVFTTTVSGTSFEYTVAQAVNDVPITTPDPTPMRLVLRTVRNGYQSRSSYTIEFTVSPQPVTITEPYVVIYDFLQQVTRSQTVTYNFTARPERAVTVSYGFTARPERAVTVSYNFAP